MPILLWKGLDHYATEYCDLQKHAGGFIATSLVIGKSNKDIYKAAYTIHIDADWRTTGFELKLEINGLASSIAYTSDGTGNWADKGSPLQTFEGCIDIDIPLTPFTNTLPIRRLKLAVGESQVIKVLYLDVLEQEIKPVRQCYTRLSDKTYCYQNVPNDFEAIIKVDEDGLVTDYPALFERIGKTD